MFRAALRVMSRARDVRRRTGRLFLTRRQFDRELIRERIRASRRGIPFCVLTLTVTSRRIRSKGHGDVERTLLRRLRSTDEKAKFSPGRYAVLLVDTPEMGGRSVWDRLAGLFDERGVEVQMRLEVHDAGGFGSDDQAPSGSGDEIRIPAPVAAASDEFALFRDRSVGAYFFQRAGKRLVDIVGAAFGLIGSAPVLAFACLAIRLSGPGPVFFRQTREGRYGRPFTIYKLRTMVVDAEAMQAALRDRNHRDGPAFKLKDDPRVTPVGRYLRATCLDELPQLWNVFKGDMSLVGPRPLPWHESRACSRWHRRRLDVRPGLTCHWQVEKHRVTSFDEWMRLDLGYVDHATLWTDATLILRTMRVAISGRGSH